MRFKGMRRLGMIITMMVCLILVTSIASFGESDFDSDKIAQTGTGGFIVGEEAPSDVMQYVKDNMQRMLDSVAECKEAYGLEDVSLENVELGCPYRIYMETQDNVILYNFPIIKDGKIVLTASAFKDNDISMSIGNEFVNELNQLKNKKGTTPYLLYEVDGQVFAENENEKISLATLSNGSTEEGKVFEDLSYEKKVKRFVSDRTKVVKITDRSSKEFFSATVQENEGVSLLASTNGVGRYASNPFSINTNTHKQLNMNSCKVNQTDKNGNERGLCWAAATASTIRYRNGVTNVYAYTIADKLGIGYDSGGSAIDIKNGLAKYNISYTAKNDIITIDTVFNRIANKKPVIIIGTNTSKNSAHAVTIIGCSKPISNFVTVWDSATRSIKNFDYKTSLPTFSSGGITYRWVHTTY